MAFVIEYLKSRVKESLVRYTKPFVGYFSVFDECSFLCLLPGMQNLLSGSFLSLASGSFLISPQRWDILSFHPHTLKDKNNGVLGPATALFFIPLPSSTVLLQ